MWSVAYYPGWVQDTLPPAGLPWDAVTHVAHFGRYVQPDGSIAVADMQSERNHAPLVQAAHAAGRAALLTIGGEWNGAGFTEACSTAAGRGRLIGNAVVLAERYGYDGVDVDWEEHVPANADAWVALLADLRAALGPDRLLTTCVVSGLIPGSVAARARKVVDAYQVMAYWSDGLDQANHYRAAGIPAAQLVIGAGLTAGGSFADQTETALRAKAGLARESGCLGVMWWQAGDLRGPTTDPRLRPLREIVTGGRVTTYPGCRWYPLGAQTEARQTTHNVIILHTMVGYLVSTDQLFRAGNGQGYIGLESHFGVGGKWGPDLGGDLDGAVWQWQDLDYQAQASGEGNWRAISIETADNAPARPGDIEPWTPAQLDAIVALVTWLCRRYNIPARLVPDTRPTSSGIAYHAQGTAAALPAGAERWSPTLDKPCPADRRIQQVTAVIIPRVQQQLDQEADVPLTEAEINRIAEAVWARQQAWPDSLRYKDLEHGAASYSMAAYGLGARLDAMLAADRVAGLAPTVAATKTAVAGLVAQMADLTHRLEALTAAVTAAQVQQPVPGRYVVTGQVDISEPPV